VNESEPNRRAGQQRVRKQQVQIAIHAAKLVSPTASVNGICFERMGSKPVRSFVGTGLAVLI
jgi:hypothetical protein